MITTLAAFPPHWTPPSSSDPQLQALKLVADLNLGEGSIVGLSANRGGETQSVPRAASEL
jgi:hypothetical protein